MTINDYQSRAMGTCLPSSFNLPYLSQGFVGEVGELLGKLAKYVRKGKIVVVNNDLYVIDPKTQKPQPWVESQELLGEDELKKLRGELGDCAWFLAVLCQYLGWSLESICQENLDKLASRQERNVIIGDGDIR